MGYILSNIKYSPFKNLNKSYISSKFGNRTFYNNMTKEYETGFHNGIDMTSGKTIVAAEKGIVTSARNNIKGYSEKYSSGNYVTINHGNGVYTTYCHMKYNSVKAKAGDSVEKGQELGLKGSTGYSTGPHLHYGVKVNGKWVNPEDYLLGKKLLINEKINDIENFKEYVVRKGDTLSGIAFKFNTTINELVELNNIKNPNLIIIGEVLKIPISAAKIENIIYIVKKGDTLSGIAKKYHTNWKSLYEKNKNIIGSNPNLIKIGQKLII